MFASINLSFIVCLFCNIHVYVYFCGSMASGKPRKAVLFRPHREGNPRLLPVPAPHVRPDIRIVTSGLCMRRLRPDGRSHIFSPELVCPAGSEGFWWILHDAFHFPKIIQYNIVHFRGTPEKFLQIFVIRTIVSQQVVFSVTRNIFGNAKPLACKGVENSSKVVVFYRAPRVPTSIFRRP